MHVVLVTDELVTRFGEVNRRQQNLLACQLRRPCQRITVGVDDDRSLNPVDPALVAVAIARGDEHAVDRRIGLNSYAREVRVGEQDIDVRAALLSHTSAWNLTGLPAISLPVGLLRGMPVGLQVIGAAGEDDRLLRVMAQRFVRE